MSKFSKVVVLAGLLVAGTVQGAAAVPLGISRGAVPRGSFVPEGSSAMAPLAHIKFCMDNPSECEGGFAEASLDADLLPVLDAVNREVNRRIRPRSKVGAIGRWEVTPASGDCNDYAVTKRHALIARGLPASALRLAVVETNWGEGHLVLVARTTAGDVVLDNLSSRLRAWDETSHAFLKIQSSSDPNSWIRVGRRAPSAPAPTFDFELRA